MTPQSNTKKAAWLALALAMVGTFEGYRQTAYRDVVGIPTICYGETKGVTMGQVRTKAECDEQFSKRLVEFNAGVDSCVHVPLPETRRAAFVSLAYNIGVGAFCKSTTVKRINAGDVTGACNAMTAWNKAGGTVWAGLERRREEERKLCLKS